MSDRFIKAAKKTRLIVDTVGCSVLATFHLHGIFLYDTFRYHSIIYAGTNKVMMVYDLSEV